MNKEKIIALFCKNKKIYENLDQVIKDNFLYIYDLSMLNDKIEILVVLGGDGTMLKVAKAASKFNIKVIGVNFGKLGFLTQISNLEEFKSIISNLKNLPTSEHKMLCCKTNNTESLNEFVIKSKNFSPIELKLFIDNTYVNSYKGDGIIIGTATGSTAYSMSAGGPILDPKVNAILITPLAIHSLNSRPIVISNKAKIDIEILSGEHVLISDGEVIDLKSINIEFEESQKVVNFIDVGENFYSRMFIKLGNYNN